MVVRGKLEGIGAINTRATARCLARWGHFIPVSKLWQEKWQENYGSIADNETMLHAIVRPL